MTESQVTREMGLELIKTEEERPDWLLESRALLKTTVVTGVSASEKPQTIPDSSSLTCTTGKQEGEKTLCDLLFSQN